ncbi:MAG: TIM barrel protein, partial [Planctomycetota bacterium]
LAERLQALLPHVEGVVIHSEAIHDPAIWRAFGSQAFVENADGRKHTGRTTEEMQEILKGLPDARVCLDLAHVYQVDPSLVEARRMLRAIGDRVGQIHLSQLDHACGHQPLMYGIVHEFQGLGTLVPETMVILESVVDEDEIGFQLELAAECFNG